MPATEPFVAGLVLAAGGSSRLGRPKQLLPYAGSTLLDHTVTTARNSDFDQLIVALGGSADAVREEVDLEGTHVVESPSYGDGCSSSIAAAMRALHPRADVLVLLLGDQPGITPETIAAIVAGRDNAPLAVCAYEGGLGHPFAFGRELFDELRSLHGDKAVWKLVSRMGDAVRRVPMPGPVPPDVDTWADYEALL
jgi:molybdenum cofactor cytidylyltransferase